MPRLTRRAAMASAMAVPAAAALADTRTRPPVPVLFYDRTLAAGRRFAEAGRMAGGEPIPFEGDIVRQARKAMQDKAGTLVGVGRRAEALVWLETAGDAGWARVAVLAALGASCEAETCSVAGRPLVRSVLRAGDAWIERFALLAVDPGHAAGIPAPAPRKTEWDDTRVFAWLLERG